jgi:hypothetical protein
LVELVVLGEQAQAVQFVFFSELPRVGQEHGA